MYLYYNLYRLKFPTHPVHNLSRFLYDSMLMNITFRLVNKIKRDLFEKCKYLNNVYGKLVFCL